MPTSLYHIAHQPAKRARLLDLRTSLGLSGSCEQQVPVRTNKHIIIIIIQNQQVAFPCAQQQYRPQWSYCYIVVVFNQFEVAGQSPPPSPTPSTLLPRNKKHFLTFYLFHISHKFQGLAPLHAEAPHIANTFPHYTKNTITTTTTTTQGPFINYLTHLGGRGCNFVTKYNCNCAITFSIVLTREKTSYPEALF